MASGASQVKTPRRELKDLTVTQSCLDNRDWAEPRFPENTSTRKKEIRRGVPREESLGKRTVTCSVTLHGKPWAW